MTEKGNELALRPEGAFTVKQVLAQVGTVQELMHKAMKDGQHFGTIPGCGSKPTLLKPGAEKLSMMFRLIPEYDITKTDFEEGHREFEITCRLLHAETGKLMGMGVGSCSTLESKYRYRSTAKKCPECGKETIIKGREEYGGGWLCYKKKGGCGAKWQDGDKVIEGQATGRVPNEDIADTYNTVLKMAKKRAHVDAVLTATAASDIFTQDIEDFSEVMQEVHKEIEDEKAAAAKPVQQEEKPKKTRQPKKKKEETTTSAPPMTDAEKEARGVKREFPKAPPENPVAEPEPEETIDLLDDKTKEQIISNFASHNVKQGLIESVLGISIEGWHEKHKEWLVERFFALEDGALDSAGFAALEYKG